MTLARLPLLLAFSALTTCAMAGDQLSSSQTTSSNAAARPQSSALLPSAASLPPKPDVAPRSRLPLPGAESYNFVVAPDARDRAPLARFKTGQGLSLAEVQGDVCYTMRSYKVKETERIRDHESLFRGYSECEMASNFQIRSAEAHQKKPDPDVTPAALK
jgi:hypothetical protein